MRAPAHHQVLVVGAGGFIGRHVVGALAARGFFVKCFDVFLPQDGQFRHPWIVGSVHDEPLLASAVQGCDAVVFLVGGSLPASANADMATEIAAHVRPAVKAAEICRNAGVRTFVFASSGGTIYGPLSAATLGEDMPTCPLNAYGVSKLSIENYLRVLGNLYEITTVSLRVSNAYGEGQKADRNQGFIAAAMAAGLGGRKLPIWGDGSVIRDFVHVGDVAQAFASACLYTGPPTVINIGSGEGHSLTDIVERVSRQLGKPVEVEYKANRKIDVPRNVLDIRKARDVLDWAPTVTLGQGLARTHDWWIEVRDHPRP